MSDALDQQDFTPPPAPPQAPAPPVGPRPTRLRPVAVALFVLGLIIIPLGALKTINIELFSGVALCAFGMALFGQRAAMITRDMCDDSSLRFGESGQFSVQDQI